jgi:CheY-like chemotaxis protein
MNVILPSLRVLLVDDSPLFLEAAVQALAIDPRIEVVGSALSGQEGVALVAQRQPDLVLVDGRCRMNGMKPPAHQAAKRTACRALTCTISNTAARRRRPCGDNFICKSDFDTQLRPLLEILLAERNASLS